MVAKLFADATTKLGLATTVAALWTTGIPSLMRLLPAIRQRGTRGGH
jgi:hypothetical protein